VREFAQWRLVPDDERSPAPAWWWGPAIDVLDEAEAIVRKISAPVSNCRRAHLNGGGAEVLMKALAEQHLARMAR